MPVSYISKGRDIILETVKHVPCFTCLTLDTIQKAASHTVPKSYLKGEVVFHQDEPCAGLFILKSGTVKLFRPTPGGQDVIVRVARRGECLDCVPLLDGGLNPVTAQAITPCDTLLLPHSDFRWTLREEPVLAQQISRMLALKLRYFLTRVDDFHSQLERRVGRLLFELATHDENRGWIVTLSQEELACLVGVSRQRLNMYLSKLEQLGIIKKSRCEIHIIKPHLLEGSTNGKYCIGE